LSVACFGAKSNFALSELKRIDSNGVQFLNITNSLTAKKIHNIGEFRKFRKPNLMKNFTHFLLISLMLYSCSKQTESYTNPPRPPAPPPANPAPVTTVSISINGESMNITSLSYERHGKGAGGGISITASNKFQRVTAVTAPFYQYNPPWSMMYPMEVSYFTRADSLSGWGVTHPRPVPRDDRMIYDNSDPLSDKVVKGNFSGSFIEGISPTKEEHFIIVTGNFALVF
jgi:hypothetical protein